MVADLTPINKVPCTYAGCAKSFNTLADMKGHKITDPDHNYCKKCDVDCGDWADFTQHKVNAMAPWLEGGEKRGSGENPKHIVCEFCGEDFKSFGGRKFHRKQMHQANQSINCPGCNSIFVKAALLIGHLERNKCSEIPAWEFRGHIQQKYIQQEVLKNPEAFTFSDTTPVAPASAQPQPANPTATESEGGVPVPILDEDDEEQKEGGVPLEPEVDLITLEDGKRFPLTRANLETWPRLPGQKGSDLSKYVKKMSLSSQSAGSPAQVSSDQITSRRGGVKIYTETYSSIKSPLVDSISSPPTDDTSDGGSSSGGTAQPEEVLKRPQAWQAGRTSRTLFGNAKATPPDEMVKSILKKREDETKPMNPLTARWWEPGSKDYNPDLFFNAVTQNYACPFPGCCDDYNFESAYAIEDHLMDVHAKTKFCCPSCCKLFKRAESLVAHCESAGKCLVQKHDDFDKTLDEITGGFLKAKRLPQPAIYREDKTVVKPKEHRPGVMSMLYKAKMPDDPWASGPQW